VNASGLVSGVSPGQVTITATADGIPGTSTVTVFAPAVISSFLTSPTQPVQYYPTTLTINGAGFDPSTAVLVITSLSPTNCFPWPGGPCDVTIPNSELQSKSATQLTALFTVGLYGDYRLYVKNLSTGFTSGFVYFTVNPAY